MRKIRDRRSLMGGKQQKEKPIQPAEDSEQGNVEIRTKNRNDKASQKKVMKRTTEETSDKRNVKSKRAAARPEPENENEEQEGDEEEKSSGESDEDGGSGDDKDASKNKARKMKLKRGPTKLVEAMELLNDKQLAAVKEMGFGHLIHFKITAVPGQLAYAILEKFDTASCSVKISRGTLHISEEDVYLTLGLPRGEIMMKKKVGKRNKNKENEFFVELAGAGDKNIKNVLPTYLVEQLLADKDGGDWFKRVFLILVDSVLIAPTSNGNCRGQILDFVDDIAQVDKYNWCAYVLDVLVTAHDHWKKDTSKSFTGPIAFLVACYVDMIVYKTRLVSRQFPTVCGWTASLLRKRQRLEMKGGGFGTGGKERRFDLKDWKAKSIETEPTPMMCDTTGTENELDKAVMGVVERFEKTKKAVNEMVKYIQEQSANIKEAASFQVVARTSVRFIGVEDKQKEIEENPVGSMMQAMEDDEHNNPEWIKAMENMMRAIEQQKNG